jgi:Xaa-Pro dipeptidase
MYADETCPASELKARRQKLRERLVSRNCRYAWITHHPDVFYFSGTAQNAQIIVPVDSDAILYVKKYLPRARRETDIQNIRLLNSMRDITDSLARDTACRIGVEMDVLPLAFFKKMEASLPSVSWDDLSFDIRLLRSVKSAGEIQSIRKAALLLDRVFDRIGGWLREGMTEIELASRIEHELRLGGHQGTIPVRSYNSSIHFGSVLFGNHAAVRGAFDGPVSGPGLYRTTPKGAGRKTLCAGEPVFIDLVSGIAGYLADATRIYCLGCLPDFLAEAHAGCLEIQRRVVESLKPGIPCSNPYETAMKWVSDMNLNHVFMGPDDDRAGFIAHGVGLELDELPVFAPRFQTALSENSVVALEPKAVFPAQGAVGIENTWHITGAGAVRLTQYPDLCCECSM